MGHSISAAASAVHYMYTPKALPGAGAVPVRFAQAGPLPPQSTGIQHSAANLPREIKEVALWIELDRETNLVQTPPPVREGGIEHI